MNNNVRNYKNCIKFHIDDFNFQEFQRIQANFEDLQTLYKELLFDYRKIENDLKSLNGIEGIVSLTHNC